MNNLQAVTSLPHDPCLMRTMTTMKALHLVVPYYPFPISSDTKELENMLDKPPVLDYRQIGIMALRKSGMICTWDNQLLEDFSTGSL